MGSGENASWKKYVSDLKVGEAVDTVFLLTRITLREYTKGYFLSVRLSDKSGKISGVVWDDAEYLFEKVKEGDLVSIKGKVQKYQNEKQIQVEIMRKVEDMGTIDPANFLQVSPIPQEKLIIDFDIQIASVQDRDYRDLLVAFRNHKSFWAKFIQAPGAKLWHHPYLHGLLEHTLSAVKISSTVASSYKHVNRDLLMTGTIFHDIGKIEEFEYANKFDYSTDGRLLGHLFLGIRIVEELIDSIPDFPSEKRRLLLHMIASHHGDIERSPIVPMTLEACLLHHIENMDAQMMAFEREMEKAREENLAWTNYVSLISRYLYVGNADKEDSGEMTTQKSNPAEPKKTVKEKLEPGEPGSMLF